MAAPLSGETYRAKPRKNKRGETHFTLVYCPACNLQFRLLWPVVLVTYPEKKTFHLKCPGCERSFSSDQLAADNIFHVSSNCEQYPAAPVEIESPAAKPPSLE